MQVAYIGNFDPPHSTENHVARALEGNGHQVLRLQEGRTPWEAISDTVHDCRFVMWTTTHDLAPPPTYPAQDKFLRSVGVPVVGYHLDLWWGLRRSDQIARRPWFRADVVCTADGGHDDRWAQVGVNHVWFPPAVSEAECHGGSYRADMADDVIFVGSWSGYHPESKHRAGLVGWLKKRGCRFYPPRGQPAVRGQDLRDLYASAKVVVGDSCLVGQIAKYVSDRMPETIGRGGFLLHPRIEGVTDGTLYTEGQHLACWDAGDWAELDRLIGYYLSHPEEREAIAHAGRAHVLREHTYEVRIRALLAELDRQGLLDPGLRDTSEDSGLVQEALPTLVQDG